MNQDVKIRHLPRVMGFPLEGQEGRDSPHPRRTGMRLETSATKPDSGEKRSCGTRKKGAGRLQAAEECLLLEALDLVAL